MDHRELIAQPGKSVSLKHFDPAAKLGLTDRDSAESSLQRDVERLEKLQTLLAAARTYGVLIIFQGMDTAGKDGAVKHVMSGVNPAGVDVYPFKKPSDEEAQHDFLWRGVRALPERGRISIFNRSYYEDVVVVRVHPEFLGERKSDVSKTFWKDRFDAISAFERHLTNEKTVVLKFFLHISKEEQARRLRERIDDPAKQWKISLTDLSERKYWDRYMEAYEDAIASTTTQEAPWHIIPADHKFVARVAIAEIIVKRLQALNLHFPSIAPEVAEQLRAAGAALV